MNLDLQRTGLLLRHRLLLRAGGLLGTWGPVALGFLLACLVADGDEPGTDAPFFVVWYGLILLIAGSFWTARCLPWMGDANGRQTYLTLPASDAEKWLAAWIATGPALVVGLTLAYWLLSASVNAVWGALAWPTYLPFAPFSRVVGWHVLVYLAFVQPVFLLGAIAFDRHPHAKTVGLVFAGLFALVFVAVVSVRIAFADRIEGVFSPLGNVDADLGSLPEAAAWGLAAVTALGLLAASYFKFQEKHV